MLEVLQIKIYLIMISKFKKSKNLCVIYIKISKGQGLAMLFMEDALIRLNEVLLR